MEKKKINQEELLFLLVYGAWFLVFNLSLTFFRKLFPYKTLQEYLNIAAYVLLIYRIYKMKHIAWNKWVLMLGFLAVSWIAGSRSETTYLFAMAALAVSAGNVDKKKIFQVYLVIASGVMAATILAAGLGILNNISNNVDGRLRFGLGYTYYSYPSHMILFIALAYLAMRLRPRWYELFALFALNTVIYYFTRTRLPYFVAVMAIAAVALARLFRVEKWKNKTVWKIIGGLELALPFVGCVVTYFVNRFYDANHPLWVRLNDLLSDRLALGHRGITEFPFTLFGQVIPWVSYAKVTAANEYFFIDNFYLQCGLAQGVIFLAVVLTGYTLVARKSHNKKEYTLTISIMAIFVFGLVDFQVIDMKYQPFFLLLGGLFTGPDKRLLQKEEEQEQRPVEKTQGKSYTFNGKKLFSYLFCRKLLILVGAVLVACGFAGYNAYTQFQTISYNQKYYPNGKKDNVLSLTAEETAQVQQYLNDSDYLSRLQKHNKEALLMKLDPSNVYRAEFTFCFTGRTEEEYAVLNADMTQMLAQDEAFDFVVQNAEAGTSKGEYLRELTMVTPLFADRIQLITTADSEEHAATIAEMLKQYCITIYYENVKTVYGDFGLEIIDENQYALSDEGYIDYQQNYLAQESAYAASVANQKALLSKKQKKYINKYKKKVKKGAQIVVGDDIHYNTTVQLTFGKKDFVKDGMYGFGFGLLWCILAEVGIYTLIPLRKRFQGERS